VQPLPRRQQEVLQATVRHYVDTTEPVGSTTLVRRFGLKASPATVRSAMGALEQRGLLTQPHTSAGRIPSQQGYRIYVDQLLPEPGAAARLLDRELAAIHLQWSGIDALLLHLARRLANLTGLLSLISPPQRRPTGVEAIRLVASGERLLVFLVLQPVGSRSLNLPLPAGLASELPILERWLNLRLSQDGLAVNWAKLPEELRASGALVGRALQSQQPADWSSNDDVVCAGMTGLLSQPEFSRTATLLPLVQLIEQQPREVLHPRATARSDQAPFEQHIWIGSEHPQQALSPCSVVQAPYRTADGSYGHVALVGPMRMAYATARAAVQSVASILQALLN